MFIFLGLQKKTVNVQGALTCGSLRHTLQVQAAHAHLSAGSILALLQSSSPPQKKVCGMHDAATLPVPIVHLYAETSAVLSSFLTLLFICRRSPTLLFCTLHTPHSSTSETCSCSVRAASAAGCCGLCRSTGSRSCPCQGWSCCRCDPACPPSLTPGPARRNPATSQSTPVRWCWAAADACGGGGGCSDDGGDGGCGGCGGCYGCCGASGPAVRCSGCEPWWAWRCGSALWEWNPPAGTPAWPASTSSAGSCLTSRGTCISFSCGPAPPARHTQAQNNPGWVRKWAEARKQREGPRRIHGQPYFSSLTCVFIQFIMLPRLLNLFNQATVLLGKSRMSVWSLKKSLPMWSNIMMSNHIDGWGASAKHTSMQQHTAHHSRIYQACWTHLHFNRGMIQLSFWLLCIKTIQVFDICYPFILFYFFLKQSVCARTYQSSPFLNCKIQLPRGTPGHPEDWQMWLPPLSAHTCRHMLDIWALIPLMWQQW